MVAKHILRNGLRVVSESIPHVRSVALGIWIHTGSENETEGNNGISHFLEHMLFKGTEKRNARQLAEAFDEIGGQVNAFTSKELTCFYAKVLDQHFSIALDILTDMFLHSQLLAEEVEREKKVITEEIRMVEDTPDDQIHDLLAKASYGSHSLAYPILGSVENVNRFSRDDLMFYQQQFYQPKRVVVAVAGNLADDYLEQIEQAFQSFKEPDLSPLHAASRPIFTPSVYHKKKEIEQTHICLGLPGLALDDARIYHMILLNNILGGNMSSRLFQLIREEKGLAYSVFSFHSAHRQTGLFTLYAGTAHGQEDEVIQCIYQIFEQLVAKGFSSSELWKAKEQLKANLMMGLESTHNRMSRLGRNEILLNRHLELDEVVQMVEEISLEELNQLAKEVVTAPASLAIVSPSGKVPKSFRRDSIDTSFDHSI
ncbi:Predicted Zn-dependent peptidase [Seinonella peptonophila]|uniref:Predicted Zn-dependent peptidase n=1 Tax=Seinonella peptonophila TaxID=112248 RepID=A0A1M5AQB3_9BACL|nr:Predicted Zn-dependent peptidase [Seinonella peptonophila]